MSDPQRHIPRCCNDLRDALIKPPHSLFTFGQNGVLYHAVGYDIVEGRTAWYDQAVLYCPYCGTKLQDRAEIAKGQTDPNNN